MISFVIQKIHLPPEFGSPFDDGERSVDVEEERTEANHAEPKVEGGREEENGDDDVDESRQNIEKDLTQEGSTENYFRRYDRYG